MSEVCLLLEVLAIQNIYHRIVSFTECIVQRVHGQYIN